MTTDEIINAIGEDEALAYVVIEGERFNIENVETYDNEVHFTVGEPAEE
jgi:hypothetical protein